MTHSHAPHITHSHAYEDSDFSETYNVPPTNHSLIVGPTASVKRALPAGAGLRARVRCLSDEGLFSNWTEWSRSVAHEIWGGGHCRPTRRERGMGGGEGAMGKLARQGGKEG